MNTLRLLLASSMIALLAACTTPVAPEASLPDVSRPNEIPGPMYTTTTTATLKPATGRSFGQLAAASAGDEGAIAYTESDEQDSDGIVRNRILLQRLDATGAVWGPPVALDTVESNGYGTPALALATDGGRYLACWERQDSIACAGVPVGQGPALPALSVNGAWPSLAYGSGTFALAYGISEHVAIVRVASNGSAVGSTASFATGEGTYPRAFLVATQSGFALMDGDDRGSSHVRVHRLDSNLAPIAPPIDLGMHLWFHAAITARAANMAICLSKPYGGQIFTLDGAAVTHIYELDAGGKQGMNAALLANEASFDMLSTYNGQHGYIGPGLRYRTLQGDDVIASEQALLAEHGFERGNFALLRLGGDRFVAATDGLEGEIMVARVHQP